MIMMTLLIVCIECLFNLKFGIKSIFFIPEFACRSFSYAKQQKIRIKSQKGQIRDMRCKYAE